MADPAYRRRCIWCNEPLPKSYRSIACRICTGDPVAARERRSEHIARRAQEEAQKNREAKEDYKRRQKYRRKRAADKALANAETEPPDDYDMNGPWRRYLAYVREKKGTKR